MARITLSDQLKKAISALPAKEKDKLLFRLLPKESALVAQLQFQLLEEGATTDERRATVAAFIETALIKYEAYFYSPGYLLMELRNLSGLITRHVRTTRDKYGEVALNLQLLLLTFERYGDRLSEFGGGQAFTFNEYVVKRTLKIMQQLAKLPLDYHLDFEDSLRQLGGHFGQQPTTMRVCIQQGLDVNWLLAGHNPWVKDDSFD